MKNNETNIKIKDCRTKQTVCTDLRMQSRSDLNKDNDVLNGTQLITYRYLCSGNLLGLHLLGARFRKLPKFNIQF